MEKETPSRESNSSSVGCRGDIHRPPIRPPFGRHRYQRSGQKVTFYPAFSIPFKEINERKKSIYEEGGRKKKLLTFCKAIFRPITNVTYKKKVALIGSGF